MGVINRLTHEEVLEELREIPMNDDAIKILAVYVEAAPRCNRPLMNLARSVMLRAIGTKVDEKIRKAPSRSYESYCSCHKLPCRYKDLYYIDTFYGEGKLRREIFEIRKETLSI